MAIHEARRVPNGPRLLAVLSRGITTPIRRIPVSMRRFQASRSGDTTHAASTVLRARIELRHSQPVHVTVFSCTTTSRWSAAASIIRGISGMGGTRHTSACRLSDRGVSRPSTCRLGRAATSGIARVFQEIASEVIAFTSTVGTPSSFLGLAASTSASEVFISAGGGTPTRGDDVQTGLGLRPAP